VASDPQPPDPSLAPGPAPPAGRGPGPAGAHGPTAAAGPAPARPKVPTRIRPSGGRRLSGILALVALVAAVAGTVGFLVGRRQAPSPAAPAQTPEARAPAPGAPAADGAGERAPGGGDAAAGAGAAPADETWSEAELAAARDRLAASVGVLSCEGRAGRAVFVDADRALATVPCAPGETVPISLSGGREFVARVLAVDRSFGISSLEVPGAAVAAIPLGAAADLAPGTEVAALLDDERSPRLAAFRVRGLASVLGVPALRLAGGPRRLGGPVLDRAGRLPALVPHDPIDPGQPSLAVAAEALASMLPGAAAPGARWDGERERLEAEDRRALEEFAAMARDTELAAVRVGAGGTLAVTILRRAGARPAPEPLRGTVEGPPAPEGRAQAEAGGSCRAEGAVRAWRSAGEALDRPGAEPVAPPLGARIRWALPRGAASDLWIGEGELALECDGGSLPEGARLRLDGGGAGSPSLPVPRVALVAERARAVEAEERERRASEEAAERQRLEEERGRAEAERRRAEAEVEASWRTAFQQAHDRLRQIGERRDQLDRERSRAESNYQFVEAEQLKQLRNAAQVELRQAEADLEELDRQASLAGIPRSWRR
jgi:hypothetical protein